MGEGDVVVLVFVVQDQVSGLVVSEIIVGGMVQQFDSIGIQFVVQSGECCEDFFFVVCKIVEEKGLDVL